MQPQSHWYQQPTLWLAALLLLAILVGCVWLIVMAQRHPDPPLPQEAPKIFNMPLATPFPNAEIAAPGESP